MRKNILENNQIMNFDFQIDRTEETHFHPSVEILYVLEGDPRITVQDKVYEAHPEDIIVINANKKHSYRADSEVLIGYVEINFHMLTELLDTNQLFFWCNSVLNKSAAFEDMRRILKQIFGQYFEKNGYGKVLLQSMYYQLLQVLVGNFMVQSDDKRFEKEWTQDEERISEIVNYVHGNYTNKISLSELSEALYLSVPYLSKYIKRKMGMNFMEYVNSVRLFHAVDDLLYTDHSVTTIALENGFASVAAFTKLLKDSYNMTPSQYRQQMKAVPQKHSESSRKKQKIILEKRVSDYLDNQAFQTPSETQGADSYIMLNTEERTEYDPYWKKMINVGKMEDLLRADMQEQVLLFRDDLGFRYVRIWDYFTEPMLLTRPGEDGKYYFHRVDTVLDFLIRHDIRPYLEMGFKPKQIHETLNQDVYREHRPLPLDYIKKYEQFLNEFLTHLINRYGLEEVENWYFEQWCGEDFESETTDEHFWELFEILWRLTKRHSKSIRVGGGGIGIQNGTAGLKLLLDGWEQRSLHPDFLTLYCFPYIRGAEDGVAYGRQSTDKDFLKNQLEMAQAIVRASKLPDLKIHVTEWSSTLSDRNILNDSCCKGAYIIKNVIDCFGRADVLRYWIGSDIFSEHMDRNSLLYGGCGLISTKGLKKPAFYAYRFLNHLGKYLLYRDAHVLVTTNGNNRYSIVCHNYRHLNYKYYLKKENALDAESLPRLYEDNQPVQLNYQLAGLKNGTYKIKTYSVNDENGNVQQEMTRLGITEGLSGMEIDYLKRICTPKIRIRLSQVEAEVLNFETKLQAQEFQYIHISYLYE